MILMVRAVARGRLCGGGEAELPRLVAQWMGEESIPGGWRGRLGGSSGERFVRRGRALVEHDR